MTDLWRNFARGVREHGLWLEENFGEWLAWMIVVLLIFFAWYAALNA